MDKGYIYDKPIYNSTTYLYDVSIIIDNKDIKIISCYRILNSTPLVYAEEPGYFYISMDNKYIYFKDTDIFTEIQKNIIYSIKNPLKSNQDLLDINNDPIQKYTEIILLTIPESTCINLALENNSIDRQNQIRNVGKYNSYDCLVKSIANNSFTNINNNNDTIYERLSQYFTNTSSDTPSETLLNTPSNTPSNTINIVDIHQYNKFYVYGLTTLNMLLIIIIILMLLTLTNSQENNSKLSKYV